MIKFKSKLNIYRRSFRNFAERETEGGGTLENLPVSAEGARRRIAESLRQKDRAKNYRSILFLFTERII